MTLRAWEFEMGRKPHTDAAREIAAGVELAEVISAAARHVRIACYAEQESIAVR